MKALGLLITKWGILSLFSRGKIARKYEKRTGNEFVQPTIRGRTIRWLSQHLSMSIFSLFCQSVKVWQMCGHFCDRAPSLPAHTPSPHIHIPLFLPLFRRPLWRSGGYPADIKRTVLFFFSWHWSTLLCLACFTSLSILLSKYSFQWSCLTSKPVFRPQDIQIRRINFKKTEIHLYPVDIRIGADYGFGFLDNNE